MRQPLFSLAIQNNIDMLEYSQYFTGQGGASIKHSLKQVSEVNEW